MARTLPVGLTAVVLLAITPLALSAQQEGKKATGRCLEVCVDPLFGLPGVEHAPAAGLNLDSAVPLTISADGTDKVGRADSVSLKVDKPKSEHPKKKTERGKSPSTTNYAPSADRGEEPQDQAWETDFLVLNTLPPTPVTPAYSASYKKH